MVDSLFTVLSSLHSLESFGSVVELYGEWTVFLGVFLTGETAVLISFMLSGAGIIPYPTVLLLCILATLAADLFWFLFGSIIAKKSKVQVVEAKLAKPIETFLDKKFAGKVFLPLLLFKFFIGTRLLVILYLARKKVSFIRFFIYDLLSVFIYLLALSFVASQLTWLAASLAPSHALSVIFLIAIIFVWSFSRLTRYFFTKRLS